MAKKTPDITFDPVYTAKTAIMNAGLPVPLENLTAVEKRGTSCKDLPQHWRILRLKPERGENFFNSEAVMCLPHLPPQKTRVIPGHKEEIWVAAEEQVLRDAQKAIYRERSAFGKVLKTAMGVCDKLNPLGQRLNELHSQGFLRW